MRQIALRLLALTLGIAAFATVAPRAEAAFVCNRLCIHGFHCCLVNGTATCVAPDQPCLPV
jgi:hypothetical protein